jgi:hypothetical protein
MLQARRSMLIPPPKGMNALCIWNLFHHRTDNEWKLQLQCSEAAEERHPAKVPSKVVQKFLGPAPKCAHPHVPPYPTAFGFNANDSHHAPSLLTRPRTVVFFIFLKMN